MRGGEFARAAPYHEAAENRVARHAVDHPKTSLSPRIRNDVRLKGIAASDQLAHTESLCAKNHVEQRSNLTQICRKPI